MDVNKFISKANSFKRLLYKTLSNNDYLWANVKNIHQSGVLIPKDLINFFPAIDYSQSTFTIDFPTFWIENGEWKRYDDSKWKWYRSKHEWRLTTVSKQSFEGIGPGSLLAIGENDEGYYCFIANSENREEYAYLLDVLEIREAPKWGILKKEKGLLLDEDSFIDQHFKIQAGITELPKVLDLSMKSEELYAKLHNSSLNSLLKENPGDCLDDLISFEYRIYKRYENEVFTHILAKASEPDVYEIKQFTENQLFFKSRLENFSTIFKSMSQSRFSRVGLTFEYHFKNYLTGLSIPYNFQQKIDGKKKPDFILPSKEFYYSTTRQPDDAILLSLKTSLKERWQQILNEGSGVITKYLATLDKTVTNDQITEMKNRNVVLVVTEWAKNNTSSYKDSNNVITFKEFIERIQIMKQNLWTEL